MLSKFGNSKKEKKMDINEYLKGNDLKVGTDVNFGSYNYLMLHQHDGFNL